MFKFEPRQELLYTPYDSSIQVSTEYANMYKNYNCVCTNKNVMFQCQIPSKTTLVDRFIYLTNTIDVKILSYTDDMELNEYKKMFAIKKLALSRATDNFVIYLNGCCISSHLEKIVDILESTDDDLYNYDNQATYELIEKDNIKYLQIKWVEPVLCSWLLKNSMQKSNVSKALIGLNLLQLNYNIKSIKNMFVNSIPEGDYINISNSTIHYELITPSFVEGRERYPIDQTYSIQQFCNYVHKYSGKEIYSQNIQLSLQPKYIYIYALNNNNEFAGIEHIEISHNNRNALFYSHEPFDLYNISKNAGLNNCITFSEFKNKTIIIIDCDKYLNSQDHRFGIVENTQCNFSVRCRLNNISEGELYTVMGYDHVLDITSTYTRLYSKLSHNVQTKLYLLEPKETTIKEDKKIEVVLKNDTETENITCDECSKKIDKINSWELCYECYELLTNANESESESDKEVICGSCERDINDFHKICDSCYYDMDEYSLVKCKHLDYEDKQCRKYPKKNSGSLLCEEHSKLHE
jgi:hypothetical protein